MKVLLCALFILFISSPIFAQETEKGKQIEFKISVIQTSDSLILNCEEGCNWLELKFSYQEGDLFFVDQISGGSVAYDENGNIRFEKDLKFSFTLQAENKTIRMNGLDGTNWVETSITTSDVNPVFIDNYGVSN